MRAHGRTERGQSLVETALSMMILIVLLAGMVDFGLAFAHRVALANASRAGARFGSRYPDKQDMIVTTTVEALRGTLVLPADYDHATDPDEALAIQIACEHGGAPIACVTAERGNQIRVTVTYDYTPLFGRLLGIGDIPIGSSTIMYVLGPDRIEP